jgi:shikimate kinase
MKLVLIGFMGTGKSSLGRLLAQTLNYRFIDTDQLIEERQGRSIIEIFSQAGEAGFRRLENELAHELGPADAVVIATGGGFPLNPENIALLRQNGLIITLQATAATIYRRVCQEQHRPLLAGGEPLNRIITLLAVRAPIYRDSDLTLDTTAKSLDALAAEVTAALNQRGYEDGNNSIKLGRTEL